MQTTQQLAHLSQVKARKLSQVIRYRQYWMATLKDRRVCRICNELAINALESMDENGTCESKNWFCDRDKPNFEYIK